MAKVLAGIDERLRDWIGQRQMFFVATAPLATEGHVNVSPKGPIGTLRVLDERTVAYLDLHGSGAETIAHLRENGRIVVMLCAFEGPPRIVRLHGRGRVVPTGDPEFGELVERCRFEGSPVAEARRAVILIEVERVAESCGYGVPLMDYQGDREHSELTARKRLRSGGPDALERYRAEENAVSIDGLPALDPRR